MFTTSNLLNLFFALFLLNNFGCSPIQSQEASIKACPVKGFDHSLLSHCGFLEVPENRANPNRKTIKIAYAVIKSKSSSPLPDPVIYLMGGPGGSTLNGIQYWANHPIVAHRDLVLVDQRGTGLSEPQLCPDIGLFTVEIMGKDLSKEQEYQHLSKEANNCKNKLIKQGITLGAYNSKENAADLEALRKHLGYKKWNLYGGSYGTRLALTMMRDSPDGIRSVVLSGPFPPQANMYQHLIPNFKSALHKVFQLCEKQSECHKRYPDLQQDFKSLIQSLREDPVKVDYNGSPFYINAQDALLIIHQLLYSRKTVTQIPNFITSLIQGNQQDIYKALLPLLQRAGAIDFGMYFSVQAYEELPFNGKKEYEKSLANNPEFYPGLAFFNSDVEILPQWHTSRAPAMENLPVKSNIPTLILVGQLDPITPVSYSKITQQSLQNCQVAVFPGMSHNLFGYCPSKLLLSFLDDPDTKLDYSCTQQESILTFD